MQDLPQMPPLQPIFSEPQPTPYDQMLSSLAAADSMLTLAAALCSKLDCGIRHEIEDKIIDAAERVMAALAFARKPPEAELDDDPAFTRDEERHIERARERGAL